MTTPHSAGEPDPELSSAEQELMDRLDEACSLEPAAPLALDTGELLRLDEALRSASKASERAVELRRRRKTLTSGDLSSGIREFQDRNGRAWRLWAVAPLSQEGAVGKLEKLRAEYREGWLTFETLDETERRRLPAYPADWATQSVAQIQELLARAIPVTPRRRREGHGDSTESPPAREPPSGEAG